MRLIIDRQSRDEIKVRDAYFACYKHARQMILTRKKEEEKIFLFKWYAWGKQANKTTWRKKKFIFHDNIIETLGDTSFSIGFLFQTLS